MTTHHQKACIGSYMGRLLDTLKNFVCILYCVASTDETTSPVKDNDPIASSSSSSKSEKVSRLLNIAQSKGTIAFWRLGIIKKTKLSQFYRRTNSSISFMDNALNVRIGNHRWRNQDWSRRRLLFCEKVGKPLQDT